MKKKLKGKHWRRRYTYECSGCGKPRYSIIYERMKGGLCRKCERDLPDPNQNNIFEAT